MSNIDYETDEGGTYKSRPSKGKAVESLKNAKCNPIPQKKQKEACQEKKTYNRGKKRGGTPAPEDALGNKPVLVQRKDKEQGRGTKAR